MLYLNAWYHIILYIGGGTRGGVGGWGYYNQSKLTGYSDVYFHNEYHDWSQQFQNLHFHKIFWYLVVESYCQHLQMTIMGQRSVQVSLDLMSYWGKMLDLSKWSVPVDAKFKSMKYLTIVSLYKSDSTLLTLSRNIFTDCQNRWIGTTCSILQGHYSR